MELVKMASRASMIVVVVTVAVEQSLALVGVGLQGRASSSVSRSCAHAEPTHGEIEKFQVPPF